MESCPLCASVLKIFTYLLSLQEWSDKIDSPAEDFKKSDIWFHLLFIF